MLQACATKALIEAQAIRKSGVSTDMQPFSAKTCRMCIEQGRLNAWDFHLRMTKGTNQPSSTSSRLCATFDLVSEAQKLSFYIIDIGADAVIVSMREYQSKKSGIE
jgi:hypothetical protein